MNNPLVPLDRAKGAPTGGLDDAGANGGSIPSQGSHFEKKIAWLEGLLEASSELSAAAMEEMQKFETALRNIFNQTQCINQYGFCPHCHAGAALERSGRDPTARETACGEKEQPK